MGDTKGTTGNTKGTTGDIEGAEIIPDPASAPDPYRRPRRDRFTAVDRGLMHAVSNADGATRTLFGASERKPRSVDVPVAHDGSHASVNHHAFAARIYGGSAVMFALAVVIAFVVGLDWSVPTDEWLLVAVFTVIFALQTRFRIDAGNSTRRTNEALSEAPIVFGLFWLEPWSVIVSLLIGASVAFRWIPEMTWQRRIFNLSAQLLVYVVVARVVVAIDAANPRDGFRALLVALAVWIVADLVRLVPHFTISWARWGALRPELVRSSFAPTKTRGMAAGVGLVIAVAFEASPWFLFAVIPLLVMFYRSAANANRIASLEVGIEQLSRLSAATTVTDDLAQIERALLNAESALGGFQFTAIARPADPEDPEGAVAWTGIVPDEVRSGIASIAQLRVIADGKPGPSPVASGAIGVWSLDSLTSRYLVISTPRSSKLGDLWTMTGHLVSNTRLAMANTHQHIALVDAADREYWRARTDESTGLPNEYAARVELDGRLEGGVRAPFGVVAVSLIGYKQLVDVLGSERGDEAIAAFARRLGAVAGVEFLARVGRSEFVLISTGGIAELVALAERARRDDSEPDDKVGALRDAAAGVAVAYPSQTITGSDLLSRAALALSRAESSADVIVFGDAEVAHEQRRVDIRLRLSEAIARKELWPAFQPQIDLRTGAVAGVEVLARWTSPELGFVSPVEFIGVAEQSNQIERLTISMLEQALDAHRVWVAQGASFPLSVNLSASSLHRSRFLALLMEIVKQSGLAAEMLTLEITESTLVESAETIDALSKVADLGARISIDDFGTGYSSLSYLERLPVNELKIDRSMVMPLEERTTVSPVLRWLTGLSQDLGYSVVAEGIETDAQLRILQALNVDVGQGYRFAPGMSAEETTAWLRDYTPSKEFFGRASSVVTRQSDVD